MRITAPGLRTFLIVTGMTALVANAAGVKEAKTDLLSSHETVAVLKGIEYRKCMGRTSACPDRCGNSGEFAVFTIEEYVKYEKKGKYGDGRAKEKRIQISDFNRKEKTKFFPH